MFPIQLPGYGHRQCARSMTEAQSLSHGSFFPRKSSRKASFGLSGKEAGVGFNTGGQERPLIAHKRRRDSRSSLSSLSDLKHSLRARSNSFRPKRTSDADSANLASSASSPDKKHLPSFRPSLGVTALPKRQRSNESVDHPADAASLIRPSSSTDARQLKSAGLGTGHGTRREDGFKPPSTSHGTLSRTDSYGQTSHISSTLTNGSHGGTSAIVMGQIQSVCEKRAASLGYMRKTHEQSVFWFNTLEFKKRDLGRMAYFEPQKLVRRASNYLILGLSLPVVLDPNSGNIMDYLRAFHALLVEFDTYQQYHPPEGNTASSLSRARIPQMFKRGGLKGRRQSDAISPLGHHDLTDGRSLGSLPPGSVSSSDRDLLPGEEYSFLLTPNLPFDPDYFQTFSTLCDVLIDCYNKIVGLLGGPDAEVPSGAGELFHKVDNRIRKSVFTNIVTEFEEATRQGIKAEIAGIGKLTLGGLI